jgi:hypothetical protein
MFEGLDEQMKHDDKAAVSFKERLLKWIVGAVIALVVFGGLYIGLRLLNFTK